MDGSWQSYVFVGAPSGTIWYHRHVCVFVPSCHVPIRVLWRALDHVLYHVVISIRVLLVGPCCRGLCRQSCRAGVVLVFLADRLAHTGPRMLYAVAAGLWWWTLYRSHAMCMHAHTTGWPSFQGLCMYPGSAGVEFWCLWLAMSPIQGGSCCWAVVVRAHRSRAVCMHAQTTDAAPSLGSSQVTYSDRQPCAGTVARV